MYGTISTMKEILLINTIDTAHDTDLTNALTRSSRYIDLKLYPYEATLPLSSPSTVLMDIAAYIACGLYRKEIMPHDVDEEWSTTGSIMLEQYITNHYLQSTMVFIRASTLTTTDYEVIP